MTGIDALRGLVAADDHLDDRALDRVVLAAIGALRRELDRVEQDTNQLRLSEDDGRGGEAG